MDLSKYPLQKLLFVVAGLIPGFVALLVYRSAVPHSFDWLLSVGSIGYRTKLAIILLASLLIGTTVTRFVGALVGGIGGALGGLLFKSAQLVSIAPWRNATWRAALSKVLQDPPKDTPLWPGWLYEQKVQALNLLPETERSLARTRLELEKLANQAEDTDWQRWYKYYHNRILFPAERDFLFEVQRGIHFNLQAASLFVLVAACFVPTVRVWWCMLPACFWVFMLVVEEWDGFRNAANWWSTLDRQITLLSELARSSPGSQSSIPFTTGGR